MRILVDMNLSPMWIEFMQRAGYPSTHWSGGGSLSAVDEATMRYANDHGYGVFTQDLDFGVLLAAQNAARPSVVQIRTQDVLRRRSATPFWPQSDRPRQTSKQERWSQSIRRAIGSAFCR